MVCGAFHETKIGTIAAGCVGLARNYARMKLNDLRTFFARRAR